MIYNNKILIDSLIQFNKECELPIFKIYFIVIIEGFLKIINLTESKKDNIQIINDVKKTLNNISKNYSLLFAISSKYNLKYWFNYIKENNIQFKYEFDNKGSVKLWI